MPSRSRLCVEHFDRRWNKSMKASISKIKGLHPAVAQSFTGYGSQRNPLRDDPHAGLQGSKRILANPPWLAMAHRRAPERCKVALCQGLPSSRRSKIVKRLVWMLDSMEILASQGSTKISADPQSVNTHHLTLFRMPSVCAKRYEKRSMRRHRFSKLLRRRVAGAAAHANALECFC